MAVDKVFGDYILICAACGLPITGDDYDSRHWGHEDNCPRRDDPDAADGCDCDLEYHAECCPDCTDEDDEDDNRFLSEYF